MKVKVLMNGYQVWEILNFRFAKMENKLRWIFLSNEIWPYDTEVKKS